MKVDGGISHDLRNVCAQVETLEQLGFSGVQCAETGNDPFLPLATAALHSQQLDLITSIAVAFARTPMALASIAHDLNSVSEGRFILGLGSQIRAHITKRFSMPWSNPARRMREFILALHAIWDAWYGKSKLNFRGEFYQHTLMTPFFTPTNLKFGSPRVFLAAVGPLMTEVAGEVADGMIVHPFMTQQYLHEITLPAIKRGAERSGRDLSNFETSYPMFVVTGRNEEEMERSKVATKRQIAFYGSTPAYVGVLDSIGQGELQPELNRLSKEGRWVEMGDLITDDMLDEFAVVAEPKDVGVEVLSRYREVIDRVTLAYTDLQQDDQERILRDLTA